MPSSIYLLKNRVMESRLKIRSMESAIGMPNFFDLLPEGCIANIISLTTPIDACSLALVSSTFRSAADSDAVWNRFLPQDIIARSDPDLNRNRKALSKKWKKDSYLRICKHPLIIDNGTKSFAMEKKSGKKCYMLAARQLSIAWGDTPTYWKWTPIQKSRFGEVAELLNVCWLEIRGKISRLTLSPETRYAAYLVFKCPDRISGFLNCPAHVSFGGGSSRLVYLDNHDIFRSSSGVIRPDFLESGMWRTRVSSGEVQFPKKRGNGWLEVELGEYYVNHNDDDSDLEMYVMEVENGKWKKGLIIQGIEIRPKK